MTQDKIVKQIRQANRIVLEGVRGQISVTEVCRREGIALTFWMQVRTVLSGIRSGMPQVRK